LTASIIDLMHPGCLGQSKRKARREGRAIRKYSLNVIECYLDKGCRPGRLCVTQERLWARRVVDRCRSSPIADTFCVTDGPDAHKPAGAVSLATRWRALPWPTLTQKRTLDSPTRASLVIAPPARTRASGLPRVVQGLSAHGTAGGLVPGIIAE
jgi:hypothetical protein